MTNIKSPKNWQHSKRRRKISKKYRPTSGVTQYRKNKFSKNKNLLNKLSEQAETAGEEEASKNLAKEDALSLIANFVKDIKKKFSKHADRSEILEAAQKTLKFYIDEIDEEEQESEFEIPETPTLETPALGTPALGTPEAPISGEEEIEEF